MLPRDTWSGFVGLTNLFLVLQEPWSLLCVDMFCVQFSSVRRLLLPAFISVFCGACINLDFSHQKTSALPFSLQALGSHLAALESGRVESPPCWN